MGNKSKKLPKNTVILGYKGDSCPRCRKATEIREHKAISRKELEKAFYYSRWFNCVNPDCRTKLIMPDRYRVSQRVRVNGINDSGSYQLSDDLTEQPPPWD